MENPPNPDPANEQPLTSEDQPQEPAFHSKGAKSRMFLYAVGAALILGGFAGIVFNIVPKPVQQPLTVSPSIPQPSVITAKPTAAQRTEFGEIIGDIYWDVPLDPLGNTGYKIEPQIKDALASYRFKEIADSKIVVTQVKGSSLSARFIYAELERRDDKNVPVPSSTLQLFMKKIGTTWDVKSVSDPDFCTMLKTFPVDIVSGPERVSVYNCK